MFIPKRRNLYIYLTFLFVFLVSASAAAARDDGSSADNRKPAHYVVVTYFHGTVRCPTCHKIERLSAETVRNHFADALKEGTLVWRVINVDEPENRHYNQDYQLYTKSLIVSEIADGEEVRWKNLDKIWTLVRDDQKFQHYVTTEVQDWLKE